MRIRMGNLAPRICVVAACLLTSFASLAQTCTAGDCQAGAIAGPYTATQQAEFTISNFPVCRYPVCLTGSWSTNQIEGMDAQQNIGTAYAFYNNALNLDTNIAVGPTVSGQNAQVLQWVDMQYIQAFDKVTGQGVYTIAGGNTPVPRSVTRLWSATSQAECRNTTGNVQVLFDRLDDKFVISRRVHYAVGAINHYALCIAMSSQSDLSSNATEWYAYEYKMDSILPCVATSKNCTVGTNYYYFPDWPRIGTWSNGFYITFDLEDPTDGFTEAGFEACQLDRVNIALGQPTNPVTCYTYMVPAAVQPSLIHSLDVADIDSPTGPPANEPEYFLGIVNPSNAQQGGNGMTWCTSTTTPCTSNQLALFTWGTSGLTGPTFLTVAPYTPGCYDTSGPGREINTICIPEPSTKRADIGAYAGLSCGDFATPCVDSLGDRMANRLTYNNLSSSAGGPNGGLLTASHVVMENMYNQSTGIRFYILGVSGGKATLKVNSSAKKSPPDLKDSGKILSYFMPSAALDINGNLGFTYTVSGFHCSPCTSQPHPAIYFDVLPWAATAFDAPTLIVSGAADEENTTHWGEYAATVIDPTDNLTFYGLGEYFNTNQTGTTNCTVPASNCYTWQTRIFRGQYGDGF